MTSYSKVFKASRVSLMDEVKVISQPFISLNNHEEEPEAHDIGDVNRNSHEHQLMEESEAKVQAMLEKAEQNAHALEAAAQDKINQWWEENEQKLASLSHEAKEKGFQEGFEIGKQEAKEEVLQKYQDKIEQAQVILTQAFEQKLEIISEAEPFLLELSTAIASQIIKQELKSHPDQLVELIEQHILRFKEKEFITVCVHPDDFEFIQSQRAHLVAVVNGETEIRVIPDHSVSPGGCIIRTAYGSVDARIDTQIEEIKKVILEAGRTPEDGTIS